MRRKAAALIDAGNFVQGISILKELSAADHSLQTARQLVFALITAGEEDEALEYAFDTVQANPRSWVAHCALGHALAAARDYAEAVQAFQTCAAIRRSSADAEPSEVFPAHYLFHNLQQIEYFEHNVRDRWPDMMQGDERRKLCGALSAMMSELPDTPAFVKISGADKNALTTLPLTIAESGPVDGPLNSAVDFAEVEARFLAKNAKFEVIDDLLSDPAQDAVRHFCLTSTVWMHPYKHGYIGAFPEDGFASILLFQIADALKAAMPNVVGEHRLTQWWAFSYDTRLPGTGVHSDDSDVSVNLWITPTKANLEPERGGLVIWDRAAPGDWSFDEYNSGGDKALTWLRSVGATATTVPYKANRAILFNGRLFHRSDGTNFQSGFENRRRNITLLFQKQRVKR